MTGREAVSQLRGTGRGRCEHATAFPLPRVPVGTAWPWRSAGGSGMAAMEEHLLMIVEERLQADGADPHDWSLFVVAAR